MSGPIQRVADNPSTELLRVLIVDPCPVFRDGLGLLLKGHDDIAIVGSASGGTEAMRLIISEHPDVVVMDLDLETENGAEAVRRILVRHPEVAVLVLTLLDDDQSVFAALRAGARGYLLKETDAVALVRAIRCVASGEAVLGSAIAGRLTTYFAGGHRSGYPTAFSCLTNSEQAVLELIANGLTNVEISSRLFITPKTVRNKVSNILTKLGAPNRSRAMALAIEAGFGSNAKSRSARRGQNDAGIGDQRRSRPSVGAAWSTAPNMDRFVFSGEVRHCDGDLIGDIAGTFYSAPSAHAVLATGADGVSDCAERASSASACPIGRAVPSK